MEPVLRQGDRVIVRILSPGAEPRPGDIVLLDGPSGEPLVKRIARDGPLPAPIPPPALPAESALEPTYVVLGDNAAASSDSRAFGAVPRHRIRGVVVWRYWPLSRFGPIR
jgi:signal peptidase I